MHNTEGAEVYVKMTERGKRDNKQGRDKNEKNHKKDRREKDNVIAAVHDTNSNTGPNTGPNTGEVKGGGGGGEEEENTDMSVGNDSGRSGGSGVDVLLFDEQSTEEAVLRKAFVNVKRFCSPFPSCIMHNKL